MTRTVVALTALALLAAGCNVSHIKQYEPKRRAYESPVAFDTGDRAPENGSLFDAGQPGAFLFADHRAMRVGDIVTVRVSEVADAKRGATTDLSRTSDTSLKLTAFLNLLEKVGALNGGNLLGAGSGSSFRGEGMTTRTERLEATVPATVRLRLPNGNLFIEGHRVVLVNSEEHHFYISGVVRPVDIQQDNSVASSLIADAEIEFTGRGVVTEKQDPPWLQRGLDLIKPF